MSRWSFSRFSIAVSEPTVLRVGLTRSIELGVRSRKQSLFDCAQAARTTGGNWRRAIATLRRTSTLHAARVRRIAEFDPLTSHELSAQATECC